ncbi:hypothetical protein LMG8526_1177 [Lactococcus lactis subsp. lactis]|nr:hypothetical protein LMG8526_1177 [Lactococcus lactis subsp. lactis]
MAILAYDVAKLVFDCALYDDAIVEYEVANEFCIAIPALAEAATTEAEESISLCSSKVVFAVDALDANVEALAKSFACDFCKSLYAATDDAIAVPELLVAMESVIEVAIEI